jgi:DNA-directed RNA polymerase specialized sigma24 family protein
VALDELRSKSRNTVSPVAGLDGDVGGGESQRPAYRELEHLTGELPPTERAAVVLRYGYDLPYAEIGAALGSSEEAARAAVSSGVRRLRRRLSAPHSGRAGAAHASVCATDLERSPLDETPRRKHDRHA